MGYEAKKTEHAGPKRGNGAYWGYRWDAKKESNRIRRENWKREIRAAALDLTRAPPARKTDAELSPALRRAVFTVCRSIEQTLDRSLMNTGQTPNRRRTPSRRSVGAILSRQA